MFIISYTSKIIALFSFIIGTILFSSFLYFGESKIPVMIGVKFVIVAILINTILFLANLIIALFNSENRFEYLKTCGLILLNIPIAILYFYIIISIKLPSSF